MPVISRALARQPLPVNRHQGFVQGPLAVAASLAAVNTILAQPAWPRSGRVKAAGPTSRRQSLPPLPCQVNDPDLFFAESPADLERAKTLCVDCPIRAECLEGAVHRHEYAGVWGGQIFDHGEIVTFKRTRGRPRKNNAVPRRFAAQALTDAFDQQRPADDSRCA